MIVAALIFGAMFTIVALLSRILAKWAIRKLEEKRKEKDLQAGT